MTNEELMDKQMNELTMLMFELDNGRKADSDRSLDFDTLLDLNSALKEAVDEGDVSIIEVGNALSSANAGNTALAMEIRDRIDDRFQEIFQDTVTEYGEV